MEQRTQNAQSIVTVVKAKQGWTDDFLASIETKTLHDPFLLDNMSLLVDALKGYLDEQKEITIIPDYDTDGICSGMLLASGLDVLGFSNINVYTPRTQTGYGVTEKSAKEALTRFPSTDVIMTTDNGSNAFDGVAYIESQGIPVLITDHHKAIDGDPTKINVNPNRKEDQYPFKGLSGTAVAWKSVTAFAQKHGTAEQRRLIHGLSWLVGISTISDVMPLLDENRLIIESTLDHLYDMKSQKGQGFWENEPYKKHPILQTMYRGFYALLNHLDNEGFFKYGWDESALGFVLGPILNSPRRMTSSSKMAFNLMLETDANEQEIIARELVGINGERKVLMRQQSALYLKAPLDAIKLEKSPIMYMTSAVSIRHGLIGLLAGRFTNQFDLPSIVFGLHGEQGICYDSIPPVSEDETITASGRSPEWFDLHECLMTLKKGYPDMFVKVGGHEQAAGLTIRAKYYNLFRQLFLDYVMIVMERKEEQLTDISEEEAVRQDSTVWFAEQDSYVHDIQLSRENVMDLVEVRTYLDSLKPYGQGFHEPTFGYKFSTSNVTVSFMGKEQQHVKFTTGSGLVILYWNGRDLLRSQLGHLKGPFEFNIVGKLSINEWNGRYTVQLIADKVEANKK